MKTSKLKLVRQPRQAVVMNLELLRSYMLEFIVERGGDDDLMRRLTLSDFFIFLQDKLEGDTNGKSSTDTVH